MVILKTVIKKHVTASSIVEVTVAMVLLSIGFLIFLSVYINLSSSTVALRKVTASIALQSLAEKTIMEKSYISDKTPLSGFILQKQVSFYENNKNLILLQFKAYDESNNILADMNRIIYYVEEEN